MNLEKFHLPPLECIVEAKFKVKGRSVEMHVGRVKAGHTNPRAGISFRQNGREIWRGCLGVGPYSTRNIAGVVILDGSWPLHLNIHGKPVGVANSETRPLERAIFRRLKAVLITERVLKPGIFANL
jgi:hypothetical protein